MKWRRDPRRELSLPVGLVLAATSATLCWLAFPLASWKGLAWVGLSPLLLAALLARPRRVALLAGLWTFVFWYLIWDWGPPAVALYFEQPLALGFAFLLGTSAVLLLPYVMGVALLARPLERRHPGAFPLLIAAAWTASEMARTRIFTGSNVLIGTPWGVLASSQVGIDWLVQIAAVTGIYGISFVLVAANAALALLCADWIRGRLAWRRALAVAVLGTLPALLAFGYGHAVLRGEVATDPTTRVAIVQGNLGVGRRWQPGFYGRNLETYLRLTRGVLRQSDVSTVFWPEAAMTFFLENEAGYRFAIGQVLAAGDAELVAGGPRHEPASPTRYFNSVFLLGPGGGIRARYDKEYLLPFAEFFPFGRLDLLRRSFGAIREFTPGEPGPPLPTRAGPAGVLTCSEAVFPTFARQRVEEGAGYLVNPSNDGWVQEPDYAELIFELSLLRAVEQRRWLVRASNSGPSAIVDPFGRVVARTRPFERAVLVGEIGVRSERSLYSRVGDLFAFLCLAAVLGALLPWRGALRRDRDR